MHGKVEELASLSVLLEFIISWLEKKGHNLVAENVRTATFFNGCITVSLGILYLNTNFRNSAHFGVVGDLSFDFVIYICFVGNFDKYISLLNR